MSEPSQHKTPLRESRPGDERYLTGEIIDGKYRLIRQLGSGGVGRLWIAHNLVLDVHVALKLIYLGSEELQPHTARLLQEARAAARLGHSAIVRVYDFGETRHGDPFVAMELLHGETLADMLGREGRIPAIRAIQLMLPIADALAVAHSKRIVHRDVKPENIFIARDEAGRVQPKLLDFGIALMDSPRKLTLQGTVLGTPDYMSPEQARGEPDIDERSDIWSFCVVLYELMTAERPFFGENYNALLHAIISDEPKPLAQHAAGDADLWLLLERGLRKPPETRWESMRVLGEALALWLYERGIREDACAASLRTSWLESGLSDVTIDVSTSSPPKPSASVTLSQGSKRPPLPSSGASPHSKRRRRAAAVGAVLLLALAAAGFTFASMRKHREASAPQQAEPEPNVARPAPELEPVVTKPTEGALSPTPAESERVPASKSVASPSARKSAPRAKQKDYDFGF